MESKDFKVDINELTAEQYKINASYNSKTGYEIEAESKDDNNFNVVNRKIHVKVDFLDNIDFDKLMDINKSEKITLDEFANKVFPNETADKKEIQLHENLNNLDYRLFGDMHDTSEMLGYTIGSSLLTK